MARRTWAPCGSRDSILCGAPGAHNHPPFQGHSEEFFDAALEFIALTDVAMHSRGSICIEIDGDRVYTEAHFTACHRLRAGLGARGVLAERLCPHHRDDIDEDDFIGGRNAGGGRLVATG